MLKSRLQDNVNFIHYSQEQEMKEEKGTGAEAESQSQLVAKEDNKGEIQKWVAVLYIYIINLHLTS